MADHYIYKPNSEAVIKTIGSEEQGWRFYFVLTKISPTPTNTPSSTVGSTPTGTPTNTPTPTITKTQTPTQTKTPTQTPTRTPNSTPGITPSNTATPPPTPTNTPTGTPVGVTPTPSRTANAACGSTITIRGPYDCASISGAMCYSQSESPSTAYVQSSSPYLNEETPIFTDTNCSALLDTDGFYVLISYTDQSGSPIGIEGQVMYIQNGHVLHFMGGCSALAYRSCYICDGTNCNLNNDQITIGQQLLEIEGCDYMYYLCGAYINYYCEASDPTSPCAVSYAYGGPYGSPADCNENCPPA
jgi:hypothetical protein